MPDPADWTVVSPVPLLKLALLPEAGPMLAEFHCEISGCKPALTPQRHHKQDGHQPQNARQAPPPGDTLPTSDKLDNP
jgi:hypothetical protein